MECALCKFESCCGGSFVTCDMSECEICSGPVTTSCYKLCNNCSTNENRCYKCGINLNYNEEELQVQLQKLQKCKLEIVEQYNHPMFREYNVDILIYHNYCKVISDRLTDGRRDFHNFDFVSEI